MSPYLDAVSDEIEALLGDPAGPAAVVAWPRSGELDRRAELPLAELRELDRLGLPAYYVPAALGGRLTGFPALFGVIRTLARRDFTVALAHCKTFLGAACVWVGGSPEQTAGLAARVLDGAVVSLGLTERGHGSDLLAGEVRAEPVPDGYRLNGTKWLINNAGRADLMCVLAATRPDTGSRGFSLLLVDLRDLPDGACRRLPREATLGVRGADISGVAFHDAPVPRSAVVGAEGGGVELVLRALQVTRTLCAAMSVGLADHALRITLGFAGAHQMYGRALATLPHAARSLAEAAADLFTAEAVGLVGTRAIHSLTAEQSVISAAIKYLVPTRTDHTVMQLAEVLGARALLTDGYADGRFQKIERDHRIVGIFDGSTVVNLNAIVNQFPGLARGYRRRCDEAGVRTAADLSAPLPPFVPDRLALVSRGGCSVVNALPDTVRRTAELVAAGDAPAPLGALGARLLALADDVHARLGAHRPTRRVPTEAFALAARWTTVFAGAAVLRLWLENRATAPAGSLLAGPDWVTAGLSRLLTQLGEPEQPDLDPVYDRLLTAVQDQFARGAPFSLLTTPSDGAPR
ncbi:acyl-CoA dehydrogenase family protein [Jidongwangia harbinensis]|uniref:acyl-CoA dehydrogenase family protein n=1 Tax=Jidongwangia harbinensis TaxID=2878561 RepID=UPI001CD995FF|nr:acyl-CoA dehydrogenase family protein [Jidongwangia harbinensis]MCA2215086.1 acyl-CoA dehydrogenase family protein [Jidongwangia harbinensis]